MTESYEMKRTFLYKGIMHSQGAIKTKDDMKLKNEDYDLLQRLGCIKKIYYEKTEKTASGEESNESENSSPQDNPESTGFRKL
jgi:hypothetical protein